MTDQDSPPVPTAHSRRGARSGGGARGPGPDPPGGLGADDLLAQVYRELRAMAGAHLAREAPGHTLEPTALVHEVYLRLLGRPSLDPSDRAAFFAAAGQAMRRILLDHARGKRRIKRGGPGRRRLPMSVADLAADEESDLTVILDEAICRLEKEAPEIARVVLLRFFAGLSVEQTAEALGVSPPTVKRRWACARAWLYRELRAGEQP